MSQREGDNKCIQIKGFTKFGSSIIETTEDIYNANDDLMAFFMERKGFETFAEMGDEIEAFHGVHSLVDARDTDVTYVYTLVSKEPTQHELSVEHNFGKFINETYFK